MQIPFKAALVVVAVHLAGLCAGTAQAATEYPQTVRVGYQKGNSLVAPKIA